MLSPFNLNYLTTPKAYFFDSELGLLSEIQGAKSVSIGELYSHDMILRSLIQNTARYTDHFIQQLYSVKNEGEIIFIVALNTSHSFFLSLNVKNRSPNEIRDKIKNLKQDQQELSRWFEHQIEQKNKKNKQQMKNFIFPLYQLPDIQAELTKADKSSLNVKVSQVSLTDILLKRTESLSIQDEVQISFSIGKNNYLLRALLHSQDEESARLHIIFEDYEDYKSWLNFIKVMHLRKKSKQDF